MRKGLTLAIILALCLALCFSFASCGGKENTDIGTNTDSGADTSTNTSTSTETETSTETDTGTETSTATDSDTNTGAETDTNTDVHVHTEEIIPAVEPTCTKSGLTEGKKCSECGEILIEQTVVDALDHDYITNEAKAPMCEKIGWNEYQTCSRCDYTTYEEISALGHAEETIPAVAPTCTETGLTEGKKCSKCDKVLVEQTVVDALGHKYENSYTCSACDYVSAIESIGLEFELNEETNTYIVTGIGSCTDVDIVIPYTNNGLAVTAIGDSAFINNSSLTSVTIPNSVTHIGVTAFNNCHSLKSITISNNLASIENAVFGRCDSLKEVYISDITSWCNISFYNPYSNPLAYGAKLYLNGELVNSLVIPDNVSTIKSYVFYNSSSLTSITLGKNITSINSFAFYNCTSLSTVIFAEDNICEKICRFAFENCSSLTSITLGKNITSIESKAFLNCTSLKNITIPDSLTSIGKYAFEGCYSIKYNEYDNAYYLGNEKNPYVLLMKANGNSINSCIINENTRIIYCYAFEGCSKLTSIKIPNNIISIGYYAFNNCTSIKNVYFLGNLENWCNISFGSTDDQLTFSSSSTDNPIYYTENLYIDGKLLTHLVIPDTVTKINKFAFSGYEKLSSITIPNSVTFIGTGAFSSCTSLTSITIPKSITTIEYHAFDRCGRLVEVYNLSNLNITAGSTDNGCVGYYAKIVHTSLEKESILQAPENGYIFAIVNDSEMYLVNYIGNETALILPQSYNGKNYEINQYAFCENNNITNVTIPEHITAIKHSTFYSCNSLTSISMPNGITGIEESAFEDCNSLANITIPNDVTSIGKSAFKNCTSLTEIKFNAYNMSDLSSNNYIFYKAGQNEEGIKLTIGKNATKIPAYLFSPDSFYSPKITIIDFEEGSICESIGRYAFEDCDSLTNITIGNNITSIEHYAFKNCINLTEINFNATNMNDLSSNNYIFYRAGSNEKGIKLTIGKNVTKIPAHLFYDSDTHLTAKITSVEFEKDIICSSIGKYAFYNCNSIKKVTVNDITSWCNISFDGHYSNPLYNGAQFYLNGEHVTDLDIPNTVIEIKDFTFAGADFTSVTIGDSIASIGSGSFLGCKSLKNLTIGKNVTSIGASAFNDCTSLEKINYNARSIENVSRGIFCNAGIDGNGIKLTIDKEVTIIPSNIFCDELLNPYSSSPKITNVVFEEYSICQSIGENAFYCCDGLTSITIPNSVKNIGAHSFSNCKELSSVTIPDGVTSIGSYAFDGCTSLTSITIPDSVTSIGSYAFDGCIGLTSITIPDSVKIIDSHTFSGCKELSSVTIPDSVTNIGSYAFDGCISLTSITIGSGVSSISIGAFRDCTSLTIYSEATQQPSGWSSTWNYSERPVYWYSEEEPTAEGNYWHYVDGVVTVWK